VTADEPQSPCISICVLDEKDICQGCYRSAEEITDWFIATAGEKRNILDKARERLLAASTIRLN
jgi:predicted Fe-S protein YdhL (DUF1289 family)